MYGYPSGPVYTPELIEHPWKRPGTRVIVIENDDFVTRIWSVAQGQQSAPTDQDSWCTLTTTLT